jgi:hypothetical protein
VLVVVQFAVSITLIIASVVVYKQIVFIRNKDLGFMKEQLLYVPIRGYFTDSISAVKQELLQYPDILSASVTSHLPTGIYWNGSGWDWEGKNPNVDPLVTNLAADPDFLETFKIKKSIVLLLTKDFLKWVAIANILAWPVAYFYTHRWLQNYAYRTNVGWSLFVLTGLLAILIALVTVSYQAVRTARTNPANSLRYE